MIEIFCIICGRKLAETPNKKNEFEISCSFCHCINIYNKGILYMNAKRMIERDFQRGEAKWRNRGKTATDYRKKTIDSMSYKKAKISLIKKVMNLVKYYYTWKLSRIGRKLPPR